MEIPIQRVTAPAESGHRGECGVRLLAVGANEKSGSACRFPR